MPRLIEFEYKVKRTKIKKQLILQPHILHLLETYSREYLTATQISTMLLQSLELTLSFRELNKKVSSHLAEMAQRGLISRRRIK